MRLLLNTILLSVILLSTQASAWIDTDMDGVPDKKDACAGTPKGTVVMANGCQDPSYIEIEEIVQEVEVDIPVEISAIEEPPLTPQELVNVCEQQTSINGVSQCLQQAIQPVYFEFAKADVLLSQRPFLDSIHRLTQKNDNVQLLLVGHADSLGSDQLNQTLSLARANSVKQILVTDYQFDPDNISISGMSNRQPAADNATVEGRQRNRRVEFIISAE
ncbi:MULTISPECIES: OmpA family protein [Pseudomonadati]|uniref:OmpA family protein n=1 Tax=Shewanella aestuarii TaxID=1028752 RepID=A0ABT0L280_9GAMM|nr:OmpA family protein [Shewanella aestuarii]MCL1117836.1 OmpA family protein [Shewanella aestuarii]GGN77347.1 membrane protein [Shewanella aestuarii]